MRGQALKLARKAHELTQEQVAHRTGIAQAVLSRYERGAPIGERNLPKLEALFGAEDLRQFESQLSPEKLKTARREAQDTLYIPIYDLTVTMGDGGFNGDHPEILSRIPFPEDFLMENLNAKGQDLFCTKVIGDSMEPFARSGDLIIVDRSKTTPGDGYYVLNIDGALLFKKVQFIPGRLRIISENADYETYTLTQEDGVNVTIIGRAIFCMRYL
jgi:phage repressor protein C with HTH and peptisase S24 domain